MAAIARRVVVVHIVRGDWDIVYHRNLLREFAAKMPLDESCLGEGFLLYPSVEELVDPSFALVQPFEEEFLVSVVVDLDLVFLEEESLVLMEA